MEILEDDWTKGDSIRELDGDTWTGKTYVSKLPDGGTRAQGHQRDLPEADEL